MADPSVIFLLLFFIILLIAYIIALFLIQRQASKHINSNKINSLEKSSAKERINLMKQIRPKAGDRNLINIDDYSHISRHIKKGKNTI